jgi:carbon monoxide dehydrogenase subunit G
MMHFQGDVTIEAPRERAWEFLSDPRQVTQCAPDLQSLQIVDDQRFTVVVRTGVGAVKGTFTFAVTWLERQGPERARVQARGKLPGSAVDLDTLMVLTDLGGAATLLHWEADVSVKGLIASVGARLLQAAADKTTRELFACIKTKLEATSSETVPTTG